MRRRPCVISAAAHAGWAHVVCVAALERVPAVIERRRVTLIERGLPTQPYHHETTSMSEDDGNVLIAQVRRSIAACTSTALRQALADLAQGYTVAALAIREPPFPRLPRSVARVHASYPLMCAADGMLYQRAICDAARRLGLDVQTYRRGEETARAAEALRVAPDEVERFISRTGRPAGAPWTEEHRRAFAAGVAVLGQHTGARLTLGKPGGRT